MTTHPVVKPWPAEIRLSGEGLVLREWTDADLPDLAALLDEPEIARFTPHVSPFGLADAAGYLAKARLHRAERGSLRLAITEGGDRALGEVVMYPSRRTPDAGELGYAVGAAHRGRNLGARALTVLSAYAREHGYHPLRLMIEGGNLASQAVARRAGYRLTDVPPQLQESKDLTISLYTWELP